jgi:hypothetical protein
MKMNYKDAYQIQGGGAAGGIADGYRPGSAGVVGSAAVITPRQPSLEERLNYLQNAVTRLNSLRNRLETIADATAPEFAQTSQGINSPPAPSPSDLSGRFGETIDYVHENLEQIERLVSRLDAALFEPKAQAVQCEARRG